MTRRPLLLCFLCACLFPWAQAAAQTVRVVPQQVSLAAPAGPGSASLQRVSITASGPNGASFTAAVRYLDPVGGWLSVTPAGGTLPATLSVTADSSRLPVGSYLAQVTVGSGTTGAVATISLTVMAGGAAGSLAPSTSTLTFISRSGEQPAPQSFVVTPVRGGATQFRALASGGWFSVSPLPFTTPAAVTVTPLVSGFTPGIYSGTVTLLPTGGGAATVVPVALSLLGTPSPPDVLNLSQTSVSFTHQTGTNAPALQQLTVASPVGTRDFTASTSTSWLRISSTFDPTLGTAVSEFTPATINIQAVPTGLSPGSYAGLVTLTPTGGTPQELPVSLTVTQTAALNAQPSSISFEEVFGNEAAVLVTSTGGATLSFTAAVSPGSPWLTVAPASGTTGTGGTTLIVRANPAGLAAGTYTGGVILTVPSTGATLAIPVRLVAPGTASTPTALVLSTSNVDLAGIAGFGNPPTGIIDVSPAGPGPAHTFTAAAVSETGWLRVEPFISAAPARLTVSINPDIADSSAQPGSVIITSLLTGDQQTVPVTLNLSPQAVAAEPSSLEIVQSRRGVAPARVTLQVRSNTPSSYSIVEASPWLTVTPNRGLTPAQLSVAADPTGLLPGENRGSFVIAGPNNRITVPVTLTVAPPPSPVLSPRSVSFVYQIGSPNPATQTITVGSTSEEVVNFTARASTESGINWLNITPTSGRSPGSIQVNINPLVLVPGVHKGTITVSSIEDPAPRQVEVTATVTASPVVVQSVVHGASQEPTVIAPGQIIAIKGVGLGPLVGLVAQPTQAGAFETRLGDVRVLFDGAPAPVLFSRNDQINAIVPYAVQGRASTRIQVEYGGRFSVPLDTRVALTAPGLFTSSPTGRGQAAAVNLDFTPNSQLNPAQRGSVITLFGTGEGQTDPQGQDGRVITTDLRRPRATVTARIGGVAAEVLYAGSAPDQVSGVFQINLLIPEELPAGVLPVEVRVGDNTTQPGVTIVVR